MGGLVATSFGCDWKRWGRAKRGLVGERKRRREEEGGEKKGKKRERRRKGGEDGGGGGGGKWWIMAEVSGDGYFFTLYKKNSNKILNFKNTLINNYSKIFSYTML